MLERFTDRARQVVVLAQQEARALDHDHIGTEHILLGLIGEGQGVAVMALTSLEISLDEIRQEVEAVIGLGTSQRPMTRHIPFTPRAKKVLELSLREAHLLGADYIGTEHILLGLVREGDGVGAQVLIGAGVDLDRLRQLETAATGGLRPDLTILLDVPVETGLARKAPGDVTRFEAEFDLDFHRRVRGGFLALASAEPDRFVVVDATRPVEDVTIGVAAAADRLAAAGEPNGRPTRNP